MLIQIMYNLGLRFYEAFTCFGDWLQQPMFYSDALIAILDFPVTPKNFLTDLARDLVLMTPLELMFSGLSVYCVYIFVKWILDIVL